MLNRIFIVNAISLCFAFFLLLGDLRASAAKPEYLESNVSIANTRGLPALNGILSVPRGMNPSITVLFLEGSGKGSLDDQSRNYNPVRDILNELAMNGIASLRFDKRGTGLNFAKGLHEIQTLESYESDAVDAFDFLTASGQVPHSRIVIMGHSLGGVFALKVAQRRHSAGLILSATPSGSALDFLMEQQIAINTFNFPGEPKQAQAEANTFLAPFLAIKNGSFKFHNCPVARCRMLEKSQILDDQSLEFWAAILELNVGREIQKVHDKQKILCIGGIFDWIILPQHAESNCQKFSSQHFETKTEIVPNLDHFFF